MHAAWWAGLNVFYSFNDRIFLCTIGGYCKCSVLVCVQHNNLGKLAFKPCDNHDGKWNVNHCTNYKYERSPTPNADNELTQKLNKVLDDWYEKNPWRRGLSSDDAVRVIKQDPASWLPSLRFWKHDSSYVYHSEDLIQDVISAMSKLYDMISENRIGQPGSVAKRVLESWNDAVVTKKLAIEHDARDEDLMPDTDVKMEEPRLAVGLYKYLLGYHLPNTTIAPRWDWLPWTSELQSPRNYSTITEVLRAGRMCEKLASRLSGQNWKSFERLGRVALPKRSADDYAYVSRGGFRMQQLHEADPSFFEDVKVILDPCAGFGGFAEYYSSAMSKKAPKVYILPSLIEKGHRIPVGELRQISHSNVEVVPATTPENEDRGNIKDQKCRLRLKYLCNKFGGADLIIIDAGEYSTDGNVNSAFWYKKKGGNNNFLEAVLDLLNALNHGGKLCVKVNGLWHGVEQLVHKLSCNFKKVKAIKIATAPLASPEWYLLCLNYQPLVIDIRRASHLVGAVCDEQEYHYTLMQQIIRIRGRGWKVKKRHDWFIPGIKSKMLEIRTRADNKPGGVRVDIVTPYGSLTEEWDPL